MTTSLAARLWTGDDGKERLGQGYMQCPPTSPAQTHLAALQTSLRRRAYCSLSDVMLSRLGWKGDEIAILVNALPTNHGGPPLVAIALYWCQVCSPTPFSHSVWSGMRPSGYYAWPWQICTLIVPRPSSPFPVSVASNAFIASWKVYCGGHESASLLPSTLLSATRTRCVTILATSIFFEATRSMAMG